MKNATVKFKNSEYDFVTSINDELTDDQIHTYYAYNVFNSGIDNDNLQQCVDVEID